MSISCPLCLSENSQILCVVQEQSYFRCPTCFLTFLDPKQRLDLEQEKKRYDLHENNPEDVRYRKFLDKLAMPLEKYLTKKDQGLDFGCGPGPTLSVMLQERRIQCENYDPIYFPHKNLLKKTYNFISASEVFEHLYSPHEEILNLKKMLKPQGFLGVMTGVLKETQDFSTWHYIKDETHVCFYKKETFQWIENQFSLNLVYLHENTAIFQNV